MSRSATEEIGSEYIQVWGTCFKMTNHNYDKLLINRSRTRQERLDLIFKKQSEPLLINKCLDCEKNLYYGKTCNGQCIKGDVE